MFTRTLWLRVHLFNTLLPTNLVPLPVLITQDHMRQIQSALQEASPSIGGAASELTDTLTLCTEPAGHQLKRIQESFDRTLLTLRSQLTREDRDAFQRLQIHEAIMAAGFYQRAANPGVLHGEGTRFVLNHFNFDIRRDTVITKMIHSSLMETKKCSPQSDKLLVDLLLLERKLFGSYRFAPTAGRRWFCLGVQLDELQTEGEIRRLMDLEPIRAEGNLTLTKNDVPTNMWFEIVIQPKDEPSFMSQRNLHENLRPEDCKFVVRIKKPKRPLTFRERLTENLLRYWVIWLSFWLIFFMIDEEVIALTSLIFLKWKSTRAMQAEADATGDKFYVARSRK